MVNGLYFLVVVVVVVVAAAAAAAVAAGEDDGGDDDDDDWCFFSGLIAFGCVNVSLGQEGQSAREWVRNPTGGPARCVAR